MIFYIYLNYSMWKKINYKTGYIQVDILREVNILCSSFIFYQEEVTAILPKYTKKHNVGFQWKLRGRIIPKPGLPIAGTLVI